MMRLIFVKVACLLFCIPVYPLVLFAEFYNVKTSFGGTFKFRKVSKEYWVDVRDVLHFREGGD